MIPARIRVEFTVPTELVDVVVNHLGPALRTQSSWKIKGHRTVVYEVENLAAAHQLVDTMAAFEAPTIDQMTSAVLNNLS